MQFSARYRVVDVIAHTDYLMALRNSLQYDSAKAAMSGSMTVCHISESAGRS